MIVNAILSQIDLGSYALPVFQRGYVWNRDQVRKLMYSLYRGYPVGQLLVWDTPTDSTIAKGDGPLTAGHVNLILDGQQRITSLYGLFRGYSPKFFEGNAAAFTGLYFNLEDEVFEFYMPAKMSGNHAWISVTDVFKAGSGKFIEERVSADPEHAGFWLQNMSKINRLDRIRDIDIHIETVTGKDKTIDVVVEIFNSVNSGGTKLSKGDLALAKICGQWTNGRDVLRSVLEKYHKAGYNFTMDWLLRCITVDVTGQPYFGQLSSVSIEDIKKAVQETDDRIGLCLDEIASRLGLDHDRVLGGVFAIVTMVGYLRLKGNEKMTEAEWCQLLYWYVHSFLWGRYAGSTESTLAQDLNVLNNGLGIEGMLSLIKQQRGDLTIRPSDFWGWSTGARFYPLLYLLTRTNGARDWGTGVLLNNSLLGKNSTLDVHHIFPKDVLYKAGRSKSIVNSLANYAFLTKGTNLAISNRRPDEYLPEYVTLNKGAVESHCVPIDPTLWTVDNYELFLERRRELLAEAANHLLDALHEGHLVYMPIQSISQPATEYEAEDEDVREVQNWIAEQGFTPGTPNHELLSADGSANTIIDLAWPDGIQVGLSQPLALLTNPDAETQAAVSKAGYKFFVNVAEFKKYVMNLYGLQ